MLANIVSIIWGSSEATEENNVIDTTTATGTTTVPAKCEAPVSCEAASTGAVPKDKLSVRAMTPSDEEESDWVLVDRAASPSNTLTPDENEDSPMREDSTQEAGGQVAIPAPPRNRTAQRSSARLLQAIDVFRPAQKAQRRRDERRLKNKHLDRCNKVREVASAGNKRARRQDMMTPAKFSRVVNNRKC